MVFDSVSAALGLLCILILASGISIMSRGSWFSGWLRGTFGILFIGVAVLCGLIAMDLRNYRQLLKDEPIATISFAWQSEETFRATLVMQDFGSTSEFELKGDQWQIDAKIIRWQGWMRQLGGQPGYRLDRISGRYLSVEDERLKERTVYEIIPTAFGVDVWQWAMDYRERIPFLHATYGSATYMPMADGAIYEIALSYSGLVARPLNSAAKEAVLLWD